MDRPQFQTWIAALAVPELVEVFEDLHEELEGRGLTQEAQEVAMVHDHLCQRYFDQRAGQARRC